MLFGRLLTSEEAGGRRKRPPPPLFWSCQALSLGRR
jgi:hypothetical protein